MDLAGEGFQGADAGSALRHMRLLAIIKVQLGLQTPRNLEAPQEMPTDLEVSRLQSQPLYISVMGT